MLPRLSFQLAAAALLYAPAAAQMLFNVTAIGAEHGLSTLECWEVDATFNVSGDRATTGSSIAQLGEVSSMSLGYALPGDEPQPHNAPVNQWVILLKGLAKISLAHDETKSVFVSGGEFGMLFAADTSEVSCCGHSSRFLSGEEVVYLQIPTVDNTIPEHKRLHMGPCEPDELTGWR